MVIINTWLPLNNGILVSLILMVPLFKGILGEQQPVDRNTRVASVASVFIHGFMGATGNLR